MVDKQNVYVGIDPGKRGAIGMILNDNYYVYDMPLLPNGEIDAFTVHGFLIEESYNMFCVIEKAQAMRNQGVTSMFTYGKGYGEVVAALKIAKISFIEVHPIKWKKYFSLNNDKKRSISMAMNLFPDIEYYGKKGGRKDGRAEAILLAEYARQMRGKND